MRPDESLQSVGISSRVHDARPKGDVETLASLEVPRKFSERPLIADVSASVAFIPNDPMSLSGAAEQWIFKPLVFAGADFSSIEHLVSRMSQVVMDWIAEGEIAKLREFGGFIGRLGDEYRETLSSSHEAASEAWHLNRDFAKQALSLGNQAQLYTTTDPSGKRTIQKYTSKAVSPVGVALIGISKLNKPWTELDFVSAGNLSLEVAQAELTDLIEQGLVEPLSADTYGLTPIGWRLALGLAKIA